MNKGDSTNLDKSPLVQCRYVWLFSAIQTFLWSHKAFEINQGAVEILLTSVATWLLALSGVTSHLNGLIIYRRVNGLEGRIAQNHSFLIVPKAMLPHCQEEASVRYWQVSWKCLRIYRRASCWKQSADLKQTCWFEGHVYKCQGTDRE